MNQNNSDQRIIKILNAPPEQQEAIDRIIYGKQPCIPQATGPLLMGMSDAAKLLGVSRATLWRMLQAGRFHKVEILPGSFRLRRADLENFVNGKVA